MDHEHGKSGGRLVGRREFDGSAFDTLADGGIGGITRLWFVRREF